MLSRIAGHNPMTGTVKTEWAASSNDGEWCYSGEVREHVIGEAVEAWIDDADCDGPPEGIEVVVWADVTWCTGEEVGDRYDCHCGACHEDEDWWAMFDWASTEKLVVQLTDADREAWR